MFKGTLLQPQIPAAERLMNRQKMLLAWEQGTGKTVISVAAADTLFGLQKATCALVLAPSGLAWQWEDRIKEFTDRDVRYIKAEVKYSRTKKRAVTVPRTYELVPHGFCVVPWSLFRKDYDEIVKVPWDIVIADEAQEFANNQTVTGQKIKKLNLKLDPKYRWALTGTAISNKLEELYSIMYWVDKTLLPPWPTFEETHIVRGQFKEIVKYKNLTGLNKFLRDTRVDRKTADDMGEHMPRIVEQVITISQTKEYARAQKKLLEELDKLASNISFDEEGNPKLAPSSPVRKAFHECRKALWTDERKKACVDYIAGIVAERAESQFLVFSHHKAPLYELESVYNTAFSERATLFTGDQSGRQKRDNIGLFKHGKRPILLASDAGNSGLDLPEARDLINIDTPFSWGKLDQRNKRHARVSSPFPFVRVVYLIMEKSIEEFFYVQTKLKGKVADATLDVGDDEVVVRPQSLRNFLGNDDE